MRLKKPSVLNNASSGMPNVILVKKRLKTILHFIHDIIIYYRNAFKYLFPIVRATSIAILVLSSRLTAKFGSKNNVIRPKNMFLPVLQIWHCRYTVLHTVS